MRHGVLALALISTASLAGCSEGVLDPKGPIAGAEREILFNSLGIMLAIVIPTILATLGVAFWFRSSNRHARYRPDFTYSGRLELLVWSIPAMTVMLLGGVAWIGAYDLAQTKPIASTVKPIRVQVVSLDWKWLFIYPDQGIASVNRLTIPVGTPVSFELTSSGVMNSFWVPQLGGQIYTMAGMTTRLHLQADHPGTYRGSSANFSGDGFADMRFAVDAVPAEDFTPWIETTRQSGPALDAQTYADLLRPGTVAAPFSYRSVTPDFFNHVLSTSVQPAAARKAEK
jgi:cytochrome o ubiquinol oxidase subunit II